MIISKISLVIYDIKRKTELLFLFFSRTFRAKHLQSYLKELKSKPICWFLASHRLILNLRLWLHTENTGGAKVTRHQLHLHS